MTKKLEELLNLPESKKIIKEEEKKQAKAEISKPEPFLRSMDEFDKISGALGVPVTNVKVRNMREEAEFDLNHANDGKSGESLLNKDHEVSSEAQDLVGDKHTMSLLKELGKRKKTTEQYTGVNDAILAKKSPSEKSAKANTTINTKSPVGSRTVKVPTAKTVGEKQ